MKKNILFILFGMLIMAIIGVGVYAINASDIDYKNNKTVEEAIDDLYTLADKTLTFGTPQYYADYGDSDTSRSLTSTLNKGKYLVIFTEGKGWNSQNYTSGEQTTNRTLNADKASCTITKLHGYFLRSHGTSNINVNNTNVSYVLDVGEDNTTISINQGITQANDTNPQYLMLTVIPVVY